jgi:hypothetical protein
MTQEDASLLIEYDSKGSNGEQVDSFWH